MIEQSIQAVLQLVRITWYTGELLPSRLSLDPPEATTKKTTA